MGCLGVLPSTHMALDDIRASRLKKLGELAASGRDPYPASVKRTFLIADILKNFSRLERAKKRCSIAGRIMAWREHGGATFGNIRDASGTIQFYFSKDELGKAYGEATSGLDIGDFIEIAGSLFKTKRGEQTIKALEWNMLAKSLRPLPEKWHGLKDVEERFRKRYLDLLMNDEVRARFLMRTTVIRLLREFLEGESFMEVETPILQSTPGGALARPFKTHHQALDIDLYLRIAPELYLKELLVGGFECVFEIGKSFRNEGIDATHNPEFTTAEWYAAYWDEEDMMACVERLFFFLLKKLKLGTKITFDGRAVVFPKKFSSISFTDVLKRYALIVDYERETRESMAVRARQFGIEAEPASAKAKIADEIYKKICRPHLVNPTFVVGHPLEISPLAKRDVRRPDSVRRFQLVIGGCEITNGYSELNDPLDQRSRFEEQARQSREGDREAHPLDEDFIEALEYGMPPTAGIGIGIDRLVMLLTDTHNIREVVLFPTMRPHPKHESS